MLVIYVITNLQSLLTHEEVEVSLLVNNYIVLVVRITVSLLGSKLVRASFMKPDLLPLTRLRSTTICRAVAETPHLMLQRVGGTRTQTGTRVGSAYWRRRKRVQFLLCTFRNPVTHQVSIFSDVEHRIRFLNLMFLICQRKQATA